MVSKGVAACSIVGRGVLPGYPCNRPKAYKVSGAWLNGFPDFNIERGMRCRIRGRRRVIKLWTLSTHIKFIRLMFDILRETKCRESLYHGQARDVGSEAGLSIKIVLLYTRNRGRGASRRRAELRQQNPVQWLLP